MFAEQNHWTERRRAASVPNSDATGRPRRSVLSFGGAHVMNTKALIIVGIVAVLLAAYSISIIPRVRQHSELKRITTALKSLPTERLVAAVEAFARDRKATNAVVPVTVSLQELVAGGYLASDGMCALTGRDATVSVTAVNATNVDPSAAWIRVRALKYDTCLMADGSIQGVAR